jgi:DNA-binding NtrC family response regulator
MIRVLIADDEPNLRRVIASELSDNGYQVIEAESGYNAIEIIEKDDFDVLLLDLNMPGLAGMDVLKRVKTFEMPAEVIVLTGHATVPSAVEAMKLGAYDFIAKPFKIEELKAVIDKAYEKRRLYGENLVLKTQIRRQSNQSRIVTCSPLIQELLVMAKKVAFSAFPVMIYGESGVGKELIALAIHESSERSEGPFIPINCCAIPENMIESELFGTKKGLLQGPIRRRWVFSKSPPAAPSSWTR